MNNQAPAGAVLADEDARAKRMAVAVKYLNRHMVWVTRSSTLQASICAHFSLAQNTYRHRRDHLPPSNPSPFRKWYRLLQPDLTGDLWNRHIHREHGSRSQGCWRDGVGSIRDSNLHQRDDVTGHGRRVDRTMAWIIEGPFFSLYCHHRGGMVALYRWSAGRTGDVAG